MRFRIFLLYLGLDALFLPLATLALSADDFDPGADPPYASALLVEAESGSVLFEYRAHQPRSPASTQKLLLELVVAERVASGQFSWADSVRVSARASRTGGSQVYLAEGEVFPLEELMEAIAVASANDACVAVAEHIGGSVEGFVDLMNERARALGLENTHCINVHGLDDTPADHGNLSTAGDLAQIARTLLPHTHLFAWASIRYKPFRQGRFMLYSTNKMLGKYRGLDGLKTGYTRRAGACLVATARREGMRLISVILGARNKTLRDRETARLLSWGFNHYGRISLVEAGEDMGAVALDWGEEPEVEVITRDRAVAVLSVEQRRQLRRELLLPAQHPAPVAAGEELGKLKISLGDSLLAEVGVVAQKGIGRMGLWEKLMSYF